MSDTTETPADTPAQPPSILQGALAGAFSGFINTLNPLAGLGALISGGTIGDAIANPEQTKKDVQGAVSDLKTNIALTLMNSSLIVIGIVCIIFAVIVALGQDKLSALSGGISKAVTKGDE